MATSQNGYPVLQTLRTDGKLPRLRKWYVPASKSLQRHERHFYLRDGAVGFVLMHFILWFHEKIERLDVNQVWDEWGWAVRPIRGQTSGYSNHASGTAADLNATLHPHHSPIRRTFSRKEIKAIRLWIAKKMYRGALTWGGNWDDPDGMHIEVTRGTSLRKMERVARILMKTPRGQRILKANPGVKKVILS